MTTALAVPTGVPRETVIAPGLDPAVPYCSRLSARSALYSELHQLLGAGGDVLTVVYRPRVFGQWFDGIRFYAAASSPTRSRRT